MPSFLIRHLASSQTTRIAAARFEHRVCIWDTATSEKTAEFETILDFGGNRLTLDANGEMCVTAAYDRYGIAAYSTASGRELWRRKDLRQAQLVHFSRDNKRIFCCFDKKPSVILNKITGESVGSFGKIEGVFESSYDDLLLLEKKRLEIQSTSGDTIISLERSSFAVLDAVFGKGQLCISESGKGVRCFTGEASSVIWEYVPEQGRHVLELGFSSVSDSFYGVEWGYMYGGPKSLIRFDSKSGQPTIVADLGQAPEMIFCPGNQLLTSLGDLFDIHTGEILRTLAFEPSEGKNHLQ